MLALRGPDGLPKRNTAKPVIYFIRGLILKPAFPDFAGMDGFMNTNYDRFNQVCDDFWIDTDSYPMHFLMHLIHAAEVIGYHYPDPEIRQHWFKFYSYACKQLHMNCETQSQLDKRLLY